MLEKAAVTILVNNSLEETECLAEHGLSLLLSYFEHGKERKILLDTGQSGDVLMHNIYTLKISLDNLVGIVISHGHYDHIGGLLKVLKSTRHKVKVIIHPDAWGPRFNTKPSLRSIGFHISPKEIEREGGEILMAKEPVYLTDQIFTTGTISRTETVEKNISFRRRINQKLVMDDIIDDLCLIIRTEKGFFLLTGCCHAGIINTIEHSMKIIGGKRVEGIVGGLHLKSATRLRMKRTIDYLKKIKPKLIIPLHCSGLEESFQLKEALGKSVQIKGVGDQIPIL